MASISSRQDVIRGADFVHLHLHSEYSLLDGACVIKRLVQRLKALGQTACAITDHGNMYGVVEFYKACKKEGIKPIIGCEVYVAPRTRFDKAHAIDSKPYHLVLLAKDKTGYQNLIQLVSLANIDGFYNKPRVDHELLQTYHEGLICLSACLAGEIPRALMENDYNRAKENALFYRNVFGADNYYIELQDHGIDEQQRILPLLRRLSDELSIPMAATNDCHYIQKEDAKSQGILMCIQTNTVYGEDNALEFPTGEFYVKSADEMQQLFASYEGALENTLKIAERCNYDFEFGITKLPRFTLDGVNDNIAYFEQECRRGMRARYGDTPAPSVAERLDYELSVIEKMGYVDYFLIVWDFIRYAKESGIPVGPGRGSGAGSLCAYCIGITGIDPIRYNLLFERFLNPERVSMPDFDIDFCYERRQEVIDYVVRRYGSDHVAQIITFGTMAAKAVLRDVGRALGMPYQNVDTIAKMVPFELNITLEKALVLSKDFHTLYETDEKAHELIDAAKKLEGMPRHASTHAAGVVITREPASVYVPLQKNDEAVVTQFTMTTLEELGLLKMDFLGLRNLTVIDQCEREIRQVTPDFSMAAIPLDDQPVYSMLTAGDTEGVFQFESGGMRRVISQLRPDGMEDLIAVISLYRPGPMESIPRYIRNRHNPSQVTYKHPLLKPILDVTYGCIVYQEQVMQICRQLAGYSYGRADLVRRAMSKKKHDVMEQERENFIFGKQNADGSTECVGAVANGVDVETANSIFEEMSSFASYAFNKSHAAAYALIAYQTAYLKRHYFREYMAALLTSVLGSTGKIIEYTAECSAKGVRVLPPSVNTSQIGFAITGKDISFGLLAVKNLGRNVIENIIEERKANGDYSNLPDFIERMYGRDLNKRALESLIKCGALDCFPHNRMEMMRSYERIIDGLDDARRRNVAGQLDLFGGGGVEKPAASMPKLENYPLRERLSMEKEVTGLFLSGHPLDGVAVPPELKLANIADVLAAGDTEMANTPEPEALYRDGDIITVMGSVQAKKVMTTRNKSNMAFITLEDKSGSIEAVIFAAQFEPNSRWIVKDALLLVTARVSIREEEAPKLVCQVVRDAEQLNYKQPAAGAAPVVKARKRKLYLNFDSQQNPLLADVIRILEHRQGTDAIIFCFADTKQKMEFKKYGVTVDKTLLDELKSVINEQNMAVR